MQSTTSKIYFLINIKKEMAVSFNTSLAISNLKVCVIGLYEVDANP